MKTIKLKSILVLAIIISVLQSCSTDADEDITFDDNELEEAGIEDYKESEVSNMDSDLAIEWNDVFLSLDQYATGMRPNATARALAYIHMAAYETAVSNMSGYTSNTERLSGLTIDFDQKPSDVDVLLALNACYATVLDHFMYNVPGNIDAEIAELEQEQEAELSAGVSDEIVEDSKAWGEYVAQRIIVYSQTDTSAEEQILDPQPTSYEPPVGEGFWTYSADPERALFPYWGSVRTFVISSDETSSVAPPDAYSESPNSDFYAQMLEVYEVSTEAKEEENEQLWIAEFWSDDVEELMISPVGRQIAITNQIIDNENLDLQQSLVLLLKLGFSLNDAAVSTWADKYTYMVMRPNVYIQEFIDEDYQTNLFKFIYWPNPSFPGYPSGHSTFASAAAGLFIDLLGDDTEFTDRTHAGRDEFLGRPRRFDSFSEMAEENAFSRIPLGVHIRMDCTEGLRLGYEISDAVNDLDLSSNSL